MNFTGERVIPGEVDADLFNEHWARYLFASGYAAGKKVLDVACGAGYGSALLSRSAAQAVGTDIDADALEYARQHYASPKTHYVRADCFSLPFETAHFELVVAFEIIEHIGDAIAFLQELRRVLAPDGLLLISTPNRLYYTEDRGEVNPFHVREYSYPEFSELLRGVFPHCSIFLENHVAALLVADSARSGNLANHSPAFHHEDAQENPPGSREREAHFMIARCSARDLPATQPFLYLPSSGNVLRERETHIHQLEAQLAEIRLERNAARNRIDQLGLQLDERTNWAQDLDQKLAAKDACVLQLQREFEERTAWALRLEKELNERIADLQLVYGSRWYRLGKNLRLSPVPVSDQPPNKS